MGFHFYILSPSCAYPLCPPFSLLIGVKWKAEPVTTKEMVSRIKERGGTVTVLLCLSVSLATQVEIVIIQRCVSIR